MHTTKPPLLVGMLVVLVAVLAATAYGATTSGSLTFSNKPLLRPEGDSEPAISIGSNGTMAVSGLQWLFDPTFFGTHLWTGPFGSTPTFQGLIDAGLQKPGKQVFGSEDADVDIGSTGTLHASTLLALVNPAFNNAQFGVSAITCPGVTSAGFSLGGCTRKIIDTAGADRQWITSEGSRVYISYHDSVDSSLIHVQRSDDDGFTWRRVGDPIVGQDGATANSTFNNIEGPIVADPFTHNVYDIYGAGETGFLKGRTFTPNHIYVSRSTDGGKSWMVIGGGGECRAREHRRFPVGGSGQWQRGRRLLRDHCIEQRRFQRGVEYVSCADDKRRRELRAEPGEQHAEPCGRHLHERHRLRAWHAQPARPLRGGDRPTERARRRHLHRRHADEDKQRRSTPATCARPTELNEQRSAGGPGARSGPPFCFRERAHSDSKSRSRAEDRARFITAGRSLLRFSGASG